MNESNIRKAYLELFVGSRETQEVIDALRELRNRAEQAGLTTWQQIIDAHIALTEERFDDAQTLFADALRGAPEHPVALLLYAIVMGGQPKQREASLVEYDRLIKLLDPQEDAASRQVLAMAMVNRGAALDKLKRHEDAIAAYDELIERFADAEEPSLGELVAKAMDNKASGS